MRSATHLAKKVTQELVPSAGKTAPTTPDSEMTELTAISLTRMEEAPVKFTRLTVLNNTDSFGTLSVMKSSIALDAASALLIAQLVCLILEPLVPRRSTAEILPRHSYVMKAKNSQELSVMNLVMRRLPLALVLFAGVLAQLTLQLAALCVSVLTRSAANTSLMRSKLPSSSSWMPLSILCQVQLSMWLTSALRSPSPTVQHGEIISSTSGKK